MPPYAVRRRRSKWPRHRHEDEIEIYHNDKDDDDMIDVMDIPRNDNFIGRHVKPDNMSEDNCPDNSNDASDNDDNATPVERYEDTIEEEDNTSIPGVRQTRGKRKLKTTRNADYSLMMAAWKCARGGNGRAIIWEGLMFFSDDHLNDAKPIPVEDQLNWVLGVALAQYLITAGLQNLKEKGEAGVNKGTHSDAQYDHVQVQALAQGGGFEQGLVSKGARGVVHANVGQKRLNCNIYVILSIF